MRDFKKFLVWQKSHQLTLDVYKSLPTFPEEEIFGLTSQIKSTLDIKRRRIKKRQDSESRQRAV